MVRFAVWKSALGLYFVQRSVREGSMVGFALGAVRLEQYSIVRSVREVAMVGFAMWKGCYWPCSSFLSARKYVAAGFCR